MSSTSEWIDRIHTWEAFLAEHYYDVRGLIAQLLLASIIVVASVSRILAFFDAGSMNGIGQSATKSQQVLAYVLVWSLIVALVTVIWLYKRKVPCFKEGGIGILFAARTEPELRKDLADLEDRLREEIAQKDICQSIDVRSLPPNHWVKGPTDAVAFLARSGGSVMIWGRFEKNTHCGKEITGFSSISFTCRALPVAAAQHAQVIGDSVMGRQWGWEAANSIHRSVVSQNLSEVARYIIGLSLLVRGRSADAEQVLGILLAEVENKFRSKRVSPAVHRFQGTLKCAYLDSIVHGIATAYRQSLDDEKLFDVDEATWSHWSDRLCSVIQRNENARGVRLLLAIIRFMQNRVPDAKHHLREEAQRFPKSRTACLISEAFLTSFEGNYGDARKLYRDLFRDPKTADVDFLSVLSFLEVVAAHYREKPELLFLVGLLNDELYDKARALTAFDEFVHCCDGRPELARWIKEAKIRRRKLEGVSGGNSAQLRSSEPSGASRSSAGAMEAVRSGECEISSRIEDGSM